MKIKEIYQSNISESILGKLAQGAKSAAGAVGRAAGSALQGYARGFGADDPAKYGLNTPMQARLDQQQQDFKNKLAPLNRQAQRLQKYLPTADNSTTAAVKPTVPVAPGAASADVGSVDPQGWVNLGQGLSIKPASANTPTLARYGKKLYSLDDQGHWSDDRDRLASQTLTSYFNQALERL